MGRARLKLSDGGEIGIRPGHHPLVAETVSGRLRFRGTQYEETIELQAGILEIDRDGIVIFTRGTLDSKDSESAIQAFQKARSTIKELFYGATDLSGRSISRDR